MNVAKTIASQIPFASAGVEMANQLAGYELEQRLELVESELKQAAPRTSLPKPPKKKKPHV